MQKAIVIISTLAIVLLSCKRDGKKTEMFTARSYYDSINYYYSLSRPIQQKLIDESTKSLYTIQTDKNAVIDTKALEALLDSAIDKAFLRITNIQRIKEVDNEIRYKEKLLTYLKIFENFYRNELRQYFQLLGKMNEDRYTKGSALLLPKLLLIKEKQTEYENAKHTFEEKYPVDSAGRFRVAPDYNFVKLSDFPYEKVSLEEGDELDVITFSGGPDCDAKTVYFEQFIAIVKTTGDTIRILSPCLSSNHKYSSSKGYYRALTLHSETKNIIVPDSFIIFNMHFSDIEKKNFKTTIGAIVFLPELKTN